MPTSTIELTTKDGPIRTEIVTPAGAGPWPAVIFCFDAGGQRASMTQMAERIAATGYIVAIPDFFHRVGPISALLPPGQTNFFAIFGDEGARKRFMTEFYPSATDYDHLKTDVDAVLAHLAARADFKGGIGTTGYCMGGNISIRIATLFGDKIRASASFHPGGLVAPTPDSPHLRLGGVKARVLVGAASDDQSFSGEAQRQFTAALEAAHVEGTVEVYPAKHGYAVSDNPSYDQAASERHFAALERFFKPLAG